MMMQSIPNTERVNLRLRNGVWHMRKQHDRNRFELSLGTSSRPVAEERAKQIMKSYSEKYISETWAEIVKQGSTPIRGWLWLLWNRCIRRSPGSGLTLQQAADMALRSGGECSLSGIRFVLGQKLHPFQPSIDRIFSAADYSLGNIRMVCLSVNLCMNRWGEPVFKALAISMAAKYIEQAQQRAMEDLLGAGAEKQVLDESDVKQ